MAVLTSSLVISLTDLVSGPAKGVQATIRSLSSAAADIGKVADKVSAGSKSLFKPLTELSAGNMNETYHAWDELKRQIAAIGEIDETKMDRLGDSIRRISNETGTSAQDLMVAAKRWLELGNSIDSFEPIAAIAAKTSRIVGQSPAEQMTGVNSILRAFGQDPTNMKAVKEFEELYLVASKGMVGGAHAFEEAMKSFAPVAKTMGLSVAQAAALVQTLGGQFQAGEIGNALKTGFVRMLRPRSGALSQLRASGIDYTQFFNFDVDKMQGVGGLDFAERLRGMGRTVTPELENQLNKAFETADLSNGTQALQDTLTGVLTQAYGHTNKKGHSVLDGQSTKDFAAAIAQHIQSFKSAVDGFNLDKFFEVMAKHAGNAPLIDTLFGLNRFPQFTDLLRQAGHFAERLHKLQEQAPGAVDRKWDEFFNKADSYAVAVNKLTAAFDNLWKKMADSGVGADLANIFNRVSGALNFLAANPGWARAAFWVSSLAAALVSLGGALAVVTIGLRGLTALGGLAGLTRLAAAGAGLAGGGAAVAGTRIAAGMSAAGAAAAGGAAAGTGLAARGLLARGGAMLIPGVGWVMLAASAGSGIYAGYQDYQKTGNAWSAARAGAWGAVTMGMGEANAAEPPRSGPTIAAAGQAVASGAGLGGGAQAESREATAAVASAMAEVRSIVAAVDLHAEGQRIAHTLAQGIRAGVSDITAAANEMAAAAARNAVRSAYSDGGMR